jgi:hypothetical protein
MARDLTVLQRRVEEFAAKQENLAAAQEQLAAKQEQMAQNIAKPQAVKRNIKHKMSSPPRRNAPPRTRSPGIVRASPGAHFQTAIARASGSSIAECSAPTLVDRSAT